MRSENKDKNSLPLLTPDEIKQAKLNEVKADSSITSLIDFNLNKISENLESLRKIANEKEEKSMFSKIGQFFSTGSSETGASIANLITDIIRSIRSVEAKILHCNKTKTKISPEYLEEMADKIKIINTDIDNAIIGVKANAKISAEPKKECVRRLEAAKTIIEEEITSKFKFLGGYEPPKSPGLGAGSV